MNNDAQIAVAQLGARMHYAVPRILHQAGLLERFYTDAYAGKWPLNLARLVPGALRPAGLKRLLGRSAALPPTKVRAFQWFGLHYNWKLRHAISPSQVTQIYLWAGKTFNQLILHVGLTGACGVYGYNSACEEVFAFARSQHIKTLMEQTIAPRMVQERIEIREREQANGWENINTDEFAPEYAEREKREWALSDIILCGSEFVRDAIVSEGGPLNKCLVIPYGVDLPILPVRPIPKKNGPLRVLFVGTVCLRKGIRYLCDALRAFNSRQVTCRVVGPIIVNEKTLRAYAPHNIEFVRAAPRTEITQHYLWADVFCLPSLCEGSATVIYEALAYGLPVVTTPNSGSIVRDGVEGFVIPAANAQAISTAFETLLSNEQLLRDMSSAAKSRSEFGSLAAYGCRLVQAISRVFEPS